MSSVIVRGSGKDRRVLASIPTPIPTPQEIYKIITESSPWPYKLSKFSEWNQPLAAKKFEARDKALVAILYLAGLRISEALRLTKKQFQILPDRVLVENIYLSKRKVRGKPRLKQYREAWLPLEGERAPLTRLVLDYLSYLEEEDRLFPWSLKEKTYTLRDGSVSTQIVGCKRAWQIVTHLAPEYTCHWLRAFAEDYLYDRWDHDLLAVSDYVGVDARTLQLYIRRRYVTKEPV